jgi:hypothetical protein
MTKFDPDVEFDPDVDLARAEADQNFFTTRADNNQLRGAPGS